jgi:hypothetical protein
MFEFKILRRTRSSVITLVHRIHQVYMDVKATLTTVQHLIDISACSHFFA